LGVRRILEIQALLNALSADWETLDADQPGWRQRFVNPDFVGVWEEHRRVFGYLLRSELVYQLRHAFEEGAVERDGQIEHVLVDEYQDLNPCDLAVIQNLVGEDVELFVAGDDDQSIYGFRHANPEGIRSFLQEYVPSRALELETCMRCDRSILDLATYVARQDPRRVPKHLVCREEADEGVVGILGFPEQDYEAAGIAALCHWLIDNQGLLPEEILILVRSNRHNRFSSPIRTALEGRGLPVTTVTDPLAVLDRVEGRHFLCLLRLLHSRSDHLAWRTILEVRDNQIGETAFSRLYDIAYQSGDQFCDTLFRVAHNPVLIPRLGPRIRNEVEQINATVVGIQEAEYPNLQGLVEAVAHEHIEDDDERTEVLGLLNRVIENAEIEELNDLLRSINASLGDYEQDREEGCVSIMTMHQAKGLSADAVVVAVAEDEYLPGRAMGTEVDDERRLLYVSLTRARHYLYVTHCNRRTGAQQRSGRSPNRQDRRLTRFLSGGPVRSVRGTVYIDGL
jgi:DNA helicase-2/ATP-dependent DNA helicase PcrA